MGYVDIRFDKEEAEKVRDILNKAPDGDMQAIAFAIDVQLNRMWDASHDQMAQCGNCEHVYHRHFDSYEDMEPVGCKYCDCFHFEE
ncbi:hypothetical protein PP460_gp077 [Streptomyces phage Muntaha]|uniref:Uncharacterized protein n=1 Tax=Streptomyces phage Muntaha TaxID=2713269 RepID=A0A6G8R3E3_9CAUD|nr:hypothetical protein PP460_gp077 [Streptomyces phage Muntaha]QIN94725.1 hypothetical protein SEA_MUNTAHA_201 [Streptomyces phage Muntaha]